MEKEKKDITVIVNPDLILTDPQEQANLEKEMLKRFNKIPLFGSEGQIIGWTNGQGLISEAPIERTGADLAMSGCRHSW